MLLITLAVLLPVFVLSGLVIQNSARETAITQKELAGTAYMRRTWDILSACDAGLPLPQSGLVAPHHHRLPELATASARLIDDMSGERDRRAACHRARSFLRQVADDSGLILDPRADTYHLTHMTAKDLPELSGHVADLATPAANVESDIDRLSEATAEVVDSLNRATQRDGDGALRSGVALPSDVLTRAVDRYKDAVRKNGVADARDLRGPLDTLWGVGVDHLERLLNARVAWAKLKLWLSLGTAFLLTGLALAVLVYFELYVEREEIIKLNASLKQSNEELERFAYICSHDMQEPVRMMNIYAGLLLTDSRDQLDETGRRHLDYIAQNARNLRQMIQDILDFCRVGRDRMDLVLVDSGAIAAQVLALYAPQIAAGAVKVSVADLPRVTANATLLQVVFQNLIGNALKFQDGGRTPDIRISARQTGLLWRFEVSDNGIGIDEAGREDVFAAFRRLNRREDFPGNGLGLSTCRKLLRLVGGDIDFTSTPGQGSTFYFTLPVTPETQQAVAGGQSAIR
ncbi:hypothetical protein ABAC402_16540 [Asticcacaulis sp. AC402]|nr:hypothetical protein ABAC402_16540 [Asticcacaulis sp. AC402]